LLSGYTKTTTAQRIIASRVALPSHAGDCDLLDALPSDIAAAYATEASAPCFRKPCEAIDASAAKPEFFGSHTEYIALLKLMHAAGMLTYTTTPRVLVGLFAVSKPDGKQRLIIDGRPANEVFAAAPHVELPTPDLLSRLEVPPGHRLWVAKSDLSDFFFRFRTPDWMHPYFALPAVRAAEIGMAAVYGDIRIHPCLAVLAMGWSHSVFMTQVAHEHLLNTFTNLLPSDRITRNSDLRVDRMRHAVYVDDLVIVGLVRDDINAAQRLYIAAAALRGLPVKDSKVVAATCDGLEALGFELHGTLLTAGVSVPKLHALCLETRAVLSAGYATGRRIAQLVGKWTWAMLACRPALSVFNASYRFIRTADRRLFSLWRGVKVELTTAIGLAPLLHTHLASPFFDRIAAVDASLDGEGVCATSATPAQQSALAAHGGLRGPLTAAQPSTQLVNGSWRLLPASLAVLRKPWYTIISSPWQRPEHINTFELRAADAAVRWMLSSSDPTRKRFVILSDSMVAVGSLSKGRSSAPPVLRRLRVTAAALLASGVQLHCHWIPSAANPADGPSRDFSPGCRPTPLSADYYFEHSSPPPLPSLSSPASSVLSPLALPFTPNDGDVKRSPPCQTADGTLSTGECTQLIINSSPRGDCAATDGSRLSSACTTVLRLGGC